MPKRSFDFKPPLDSAFVMRLLQRLVPAALRVRKIAGVEVAPEDWERLHRLDGQRVILTPNHPTDDEPTIIWHLARELRRSFNFLVSRHVFDWIGGAVGWFLQRGGCYSVLRATSDRQAVRMTRQLLVAGKRWLVLFPEGETGSLNDLVLPFHSGAVQMGFWALEDLRQEALVKLDEGTLLLLNTVADVAEVLSQEQRLELAELAESRHGR